MSTQNLNYSNLDARYTKPTDVDTKIAAQATTDAGQYAAKVSDWTNGLLNATTRNIKTKLADFISVKDFGALGDGVTDDSTAITNAITAAATNGLPVFFPPGDYRGENITVPNYVHLIGSTGGFTRFASAPLTPGYGTRRCAVRFYRLSATSSNPMIILAGAGSGIVNMWLEGAGAPGTILVQQGFETTVENVRCYNGTGIGLDIQKGE